MISSSKFDSSQIIFDRHRPLNGRLSLSYDHISPQLRRRKFKPREGERERREGAQKRTRDAEPVFCVTHNENSSVWFFGLGTPTPSPSPQRNPFSSPPSPVFRCLYRRLTRGEIMRWRPFLILLHLGPRRPRAATREPPLIRRVR